MSIAHNRLRFRGGVNHGSGINEARLYGQTSKQKTTCFSLKIFFAIVTSTICTELSTGNKDRSRKMHSDVVIVLCAEEGVACGGEEDETFCRKGGENTGAFSAKAVQTCAPARNKRRTNKSTADASMMLTHRHMRAITHF